MAFWAGIGVGFAIGSDEGLGEFGVQVEIGNLELLFEETLTSTCRC